VRFTESPAMTANQLAIANLLKTAGLDTANLTPEGVDQILAGCLGAGSAAAAEAPKSAGAAAVPVAAVPAGASEAQPISTDAKPIATAQEPPKGAAVMQEDKDKSLATFREALTIVVTPLQTQLKGMENQLASVTAKLSASDAANARATLATFCEQHKDRIFPYELDANVGPTLIDQALNLPDVVVATFSEGKVSPRQAFLNSIARRPPIAKFAEHVKAPASNPADAQRDRRNSLLAATDIGRAALKMEQAAAVPAGRK